MKFVLSCDVESKMLIRKEIAVIHKGMKYFFLPDKNGMFSKLKIVADVSNPEKFYSTVESFPKEKVKHKFNVNIDIDLFESMVREFQEVESSIAFGGNLTRIKWNEPEHELICETQEEKVKAVIEKFYYKEDHDNKAVSLNAKEIKEILKYKELHQSITVFKAFWREAMNDYRSFKYINAFFNFYFILEGLYGKGKTKNSLVKKEMLSSKYFCESVDKIILANIGRHPEQKQKIVEMLKKKNKKLDREGIVHLLVSARGDLHHFINNSNRQQGTPFDHKEFYPLAHVALGLAYHGILLKMIELNTGKNALDTG